jgi:hypothetical protein
MFINVVNDLRSIFNAPIRRLIMVTFHTDGQTFKEIVERNLFYVDKTKYLYNLSSRKCLFLSRPRRFGKSLLLGAMKELFLGNRELFKNLWIGKSDYDFTPYPVIHLAMTSASDTKEELKNTISGKLVRAGKSAGIETTFAEPSLMLEMMFSAFMNKFGTNVQVVVLIDEYDSPIQSVITNVQKAEENRSVLHSFYNELKTLSDQGMIRFLFVTGVTKFAKASFFSVFNQYSDLTLDADYAGVCGFTHQEFEDHLAGFLPKILEHNKLKGYLPANTTVAEFKQQVYDYYDGYSWNGETRVFNPYSLVKFLYEKEIRPNWYTSGTPTFLMDLIRKKPVEFTKAQSHPLNVTALESIDIGKLKLVPPSLSNRISDC